MKAGLSKQAGGGHASKGFALVATISIMVLLVLIVVGMLTLSRSETKKAKSSEHQLVAQANARMALVIALGELQEAAGSDQRITANSSILEVGAVSQGQILGVWDSIGVNSGVNDTKDLDSLARAYKDSYDDKKRNDRFRKWLISGEQTDVEDIDFPKSSPKTNSVNLVGARTLGEQDESSLSADLKTKLVKASLVDVKDAQDVVTGQYAWAVAGENLKARVDMTHSNVGGDSEKVMQRAGSSVNAIKVMSNAGDFGEKFIDGGGLSKELEKVNSIDSLRLAASNGQSVSQADLGAYYSDLSVVSSGLLTDAKWGGWKKDINLLGELENIPSELALSANSSSQVFFGNGDTRTHGAYWEDLWHYTRSYKSFADGGLIQWTGSTPTYSLGPDWLSAAQRRGWQMRMPILSKYMWLISYMGEPVTAGNRVSMILQPIVEFWNPFTIPLLMPADSRYTTDLVTFPIKIQMRSGSSNIITPGKPFRWIFNEGATAGVIGNSWAQYVVDFSSTTMGPGEVVLYTDPTRRSAASAGGTNIFPMQKGFDPRGGIKYERIGHGAGGAEAIAMPGSSIEIQYELDLPYTFHYKTAFHRVGGTAQGRDAGTGEAIAPAGSNWAEQANTVPQNSQASVFQASNYGGYTFVPSATPRADYIYGLALRSELAPALVGGTTRTLSEGRKFAHHLYGNITNGRSHISGDKEIMLDASPYIYYGRRVAGNNNIPIELNGNGGRDNGFQGRDYTSAGQTNIASRELPVQPLTSMAQLQHANLGNYQIAFDFINQTEAEISNNALLNEKLVSHPSVDYAFGNSYAPPFVDADKIEELGRTSPLGQKFTDGNYSTLSVHDTGFQTTLHDKSWKLNEALWDEWFLSSIGDWTNPLVSNPRAKTQLVGEFVNDNKPLVNSRYLPNIKEKTTAQSDIDGNEGFLKVAQYIESEGAFNVNSTSKYAWKAVLGGLDLKTSDLLYLDKLSSSLTKEPTSDGDYAFSRFSLPNGAATPSSGTSAADRDGRYLGVRKLTDSELDLLSEKIVEEVQLRGPFLSLSEFMNRRLDGQGDLWRRGAIQAAIEKAELNNTVESDSESILVSALDGGPNGYKNTEALKSYTSGGYNGPLYTVTGAPSHLSQADVLMSVAPSLSVRCDTFTIRTYGDSRDASGKVIARAWCEAVVKRTPEYVDPQGDASNKQIVDLNGSISSLSSRNSKYGRKMQIVSFRWLSADEI